NVRLRVYTATLVMTLNYFRKTYFIDMGTDFRRNRTNNYT
ncbi:unnamed protein product, partial [Allacma fusca]